MNPIDGSMAGRRRRRGTSVTASSLLALAVVAAVTAATSAQQQQQPPGQPVNPPSCPPAQASLSPCVSYFIGNSSSPSDACCEQMRAMFQSQAPCLCAAVASAPSPLAPVLGGVQSLLPSACNLPLNACTNATGTTDSAPAGGGTTAPPSSGTTAAAAAPAMGPAGTVPATPYGGGSKSVPTTQDSAAAAGHGGGTSSAAVLISFVLAYACVI
ncbi:hypothetical protein ABZP36_017694 [Zizania latifolia]